MAEGVRIVATSIPLFVEVRQARSVSSSGELVITAVRPDDVDTAVLVKVQGLELRFETSSRLPGADLLSVLHVAETGRLFLGGGERSCVVDLATRSVEHAFDHCLFWSFEPGPRPGLVLELGELDALFRALDGSVVSQLTIEPPWTSAVEEDGIHFDIAGVGTRVLGFPG
jgi:hypothetical protein